MKAVSSVLLVTFTCSCMQPAFAAFKANPFQAANARTQPTVEDAYAKLIANVEEASKRATRNRSQARQSKGEAAAIRTLGQQLEALERTIDANFEQEAARLDRINSPDVLKERHAAAVSTYSSKRAELKKLILQISAADDHDSDQSRDVALAALASFFDRNPQSQRRSPTDLSNLPLRLPTEHARVPKTAEKSKDLTVKLFAAPSSADLAESEDVQITQAIRDKAIELRHNPVTIYNWVRNNIEYIPTYGSIQGSDMVLQTRRGNAFDTASLLIALLRASDIPARYVYGTIEIPIQQAMNWVGGVNKADAAVSILGQGGVPNTAVVAGGTITKIRMEHVWVESWVDFLPSGAARSTQGDTWIPLDPSFKQYDYSAGSNIPSAVPFDTTSFVNLAKQGAIVNEAEGWVQNLNQANVNAQLLAYRDRVKSYVEQTNPNATIGDLIGKKAIRVTTEERLASTLPYAVLSRADAYPVLPDNLRHKLQIDLFADDGTSLVTATRSLPSLAGKRISVSYVPSTEADQAVISDAADNGSPSFPAYLIRVTPSFAIEGDIIERGPSVQMGSRHTLNVRVVAPWYAEDRRYPLTAGDFSVLGLNPAGLTASYYSKRLVDHDLRSGSSSEDYVAEMLYQVVSGWWTEKFVYNDLASAAYHVVSYQLPSHAVASAPVAIDYFFGVPRSGTYVRRALDGKEDFVTAVHSDNSNDVRARYMREIGHVGSFLEANIFDQAFPGAAELSVSTTAILRQANLQGIKTFTVTRANAATALSTIQTTSDVLQDVQDALNAGMRVTIPERDVQIANYVGTGYILEDIDTGAAAYLISGGANGGGAPTDAQVAPLPEVPASPVIGLAASSALRDAGAKLVVDNGVIVGLAFLAPQATTEVAVGAALLPWLIAIIVVLVLLTAAFAYVNSKYPEEDPPLILRHYTDTAGVFGILAIHTILQSLKGTFGSGVYFASSDFERGLGAGCPPNGLAVATRYQIPPPPEPPDASFVTGYVEIAVTRPKWYEIAVNPNSNNVPEVIITRPLFPTPIPDRVNGGFRKGLYIGDYAFGIQLVDVCTP